MTYRLPHRAVSVTALALLMLVGCSDTGTTEPTASQAEATLKNHITQVLEKVYASDVEVTDPGGKDVPCGDGKVKRTYGVTAVEELGSGDPEGILLAMVGALDGIAEYDSAGSPNGALKREMENSEHQTRITLESPGKRQIIVKGETSCLTP